MKPRALKPFVEDDDAFINTTRDATNRERLVADLTRRRACLFWCAIVATVVLVAALSASVALGRAFLTAPLLVFVYFWIKFSECSLTLRMLRLFATLADQKADNS